MSEGNIDARSGPAPGLRQTREPDTDSSRVIMLIRHGEKPHDEDRGVTLSGEPNKKSLTVTAWARAGALVELFAPMVGPLRPGLVRPRALFASNRRGPGAGSGRQRQTLQLIAMRLRVDVNLDHGVGEEQQLVDAVRQIPGPVLICWKHDYMAAIATLLVGDPGAEVPAAWPDDRYDLVWVFAGSGGQVATGCDLVQIPELVLPGDRCTPIK